MLNEGILIQGTHNICDALSNKDINKIIKSYKIVLKKINILLKKSRHTR